MTDAVQILHGDSREMLKAFADNTFDSCVTDPPYALVSITKRFGKPGSAPAKGNSAYMRASAGFMGQQWDTGETAFDPEFWREVFRVMKPGAHLVAFSGTRTYHRMACAIEDAGFEVRDMLSFMYGVGFPKSHNISKKLHGSKECCSCDPHLRGVPKAVVSEESISGDTKQNVQPGMPEDDDRRTEDRRSIAAKQAGYDSLRQMWNAANNAAGVDAERSDEHLLQSVVPSDGARSPPDTVREQYEGEKTGSAVRAKESIMEGRRDVQAATRELQRRSLCEGADMGSSDSAGGQIHHGASVSDASDVRVLHDPDGSSESHRSQSIEQSSGQSGTLADERGSQARGGWPICGWCSKPIIPEGLGTALKPACEPICLARKPLSEKTVAANVLRWGTGALNIDATRIRGGGPSSPRGSSKLDTSGNEGWTRPWMEDRKEVARREAAAMDRLDKLGRWPANVILSWPEDEYALRRDVTTEQKAALYRWLSENT